MTTRFKFSEPKPYQYIVVPYQQKVQHLIQECKTEVNDHVLIHHTGALLIQSGMANTS